jgi:hypothetical protein
MLEIIENPAFDGNRAVSPGCYHWIMREPTPPLLTYTTAQVCAALQISPTTLWRLEQRGLLAPIPHLRHKRYSVAAVQKFASSATAG